MKIKILVLTLFLSAFGSSNQAWAVGEVLKFDTFGTKYCPGKAPVALDSSNTPALYARVDSSTQITMFKDAALSVPVFVLKVKASLLPPIPDKGPQAYIDAKYSADGSNYFVLNGKIMFNKAGTLINYAYVNFIRRGISTTCSSSGRLEGKRLI